MFNQDYAPGNGNSLQSLWNGIFLRVDGAQALSAMASECPPAWGRFTPEGRSAHHHHRSLDRAEVDRLSIQLVLGGANIAAADHVLSTAELAARDQSHGSAARTGHDGHKRILRMTHLRLVFQYENRSGVHSIGDPFFQKLQIG
jgi:hypothetical protein